MTTMNSDQERRLRAARAWYDAGLCVIPASADGSKSPFGQWANYQKERPSWPVLEAWLKSGQYDGFGLICGAVSGNLEMFEVEGRAAALKDGLGMRMIEHGYADLWVRISTGYLEKTPSGGFHWLLRVEDEPRRNMKLARRPATAEELAADPDDKVKVLIETRGEGGFTIVSPSGGRTHPEGGEWTWVSGRPSDIPVLTVEERDALHAIASTFDEMPAKVVAERTESKPRAEGDPLRPGDDFNLRATWEDILCPLGWARVGSLGETKTWRRPGKSFGISATTGRNDGDNLYVFSSSTIFDTETPYSKFHAYALIHHNGDFSAAARDLARQGYGERRPFDGEAAPTELVVSTAADDEAFWAARPMLTHIRDFARARRASPYGVLGVVLARVITQIPPNVTLPPLVGSQASLNLFVALVGPSGSGKGAAEQCGADAVDVGEVESSPVGSGEGIGHLYKRRDGQGNLHTIRTAVLFTIPEVDNLTALGQRQGATLMPQLRSAWSGEKIGFAYADPKKALPIDKHTYRMGLILGVQPGRAAPLLEDADGGTPQRFLWMPVTDPHAPDVAPAAPAKQVWRSNWGGSWEPDAFAEYIELPIPDSVRLEIGITALSRLRGKSEALDGHAGLAKLKVAAALGLLDCRREINEQDWELAGHLMAVSDATRAGVVAFLSDKMKRSNNARGEAEGNRAVMVEEKKAEAAAQRVARRVVAALASGELSKAEVRRAVAARDRVYFDDALERLVAAGQVSVDKGEKGETLRIVR